MKTILVVCGSGIATSTVAVAEIQNRLRERNIDVNIRQCDVFSVGSNLAGVSLIASTCAFKGDYGVPIVNVIPLLTGIGEEKVIDEIISIINW